MGINHHRRDRNHHPEASMKTQIIINMLLLCAAPLQIICTATDSRPPAEWQAAEQLVKMGCQIELLVQDGKIVVDSVDASGRVIEDKNGDRLEPLTKEFFSCLKELHQHHL